MTAPAWPHTQPAKSRLLIVLVLDTSASMNTDNAIGQLNDALRAWRAQLRDDHNLARIGEIAVVSFGAGGVRTVDPTGRGTEPVDAPFVPIDQFNPPILRASGYSPLVKAIKRATTMVDDRRRELNASGIQMAYRPLVYLLTDGAPSDEAGRPCQLWRGLASELRRQEEQVALRFFAFGVRGADPEVLRVLAPDSHLQVTGTDFEEALTKVRQSIERAVRSGEAGRVEDPSWDAMHEWFTAQAQAQ